MEPLIVYHIENGKCLHRCFPWFYSLRETLKQYTMRCILIEEPELKKLLHELLRTQDKHEQ